MAAIPTGDMLWWQSGTALACCTYAGCQGYKQHQHQHGTQQLLCLQMSERLCWIPPSGCVAWHLEESQQDQVPYQPLQQQQMLEVQAC